MRAVGFFAAVSFVVIAALAALFLAAFPEPDARRAVLGSAVVAYVVQVLAFTIVRLTVKTNLWAGWALGAVVRLVTLVAYGFLAGSALGLPLGPALLSLATFYFVTMILEPIFLNK